MCMIVCGISCYICLQTDSVACLLQCQSQKKSFITAGGEHVKWLRKKGPVTECVHVRLSDKCEVK